jgi:hypothetical protein
MVYPGAFHPAASSDDPSATLGDVHVAANDVIS